MCETAVKFSCFRDFRRVSDDARGVSAVDYNVMNETSTAMGCLNETVSYVGVEWMVWLGV